MKIYPKKEKTYKMKRQIIVDKDPHRYIIDSWVSLLRKYCIINLLVILAEPKNNYLSWEKASLSKIFIVLN